jgi:2-hydroxychromene-2-carboxylate isomerase
MADPLRFYFDFASPYAWFALRRIGALAAAHGREIAYRPVILWAVLKAQGIEDPMASEARKSYMLADMARSAAFFDAPFRFPEPFRISTHRIARLFHALTATRPEIAADLARAAFESFFVRGENIAAPEALPAIRAVTGLDGEALAALIDSAAGRYGLEAAVQSAIGAGVIGSPFFVLDGEGFFGADRLPQIEWRLAAVETKGRTK